MIEYGPFPGGFMGLLDGVLGNASKIDPQKIQHRTKAGLKVE
jgi:hypothetical protein